MVGDGDESAPSVEERLVELEIRSEFESRKVGDLDEVVREFTRRVEALERELREIKSLLAGALADQAAEDGPRPEPS